MPMFYTLVLHVLGKVLVKSRGRLWSFQIQHILSSYSYLTTTFPIKNGLLLTLCWIKMHIP